MWLARLDAEKRFAQPEDVARAWSDARKNVEGDGLEDVWLWGLGSQDVRHSPAGTLKENTEDDVIKDVAVLEVRGVIHLTRTGCSPVPVRSS